jgi:hypothetical protein
VQTIADPLERAAVTQDAGSHLGLDRVDGALMQREKSKKKIGACRGVEDNMQNTNELRGGGELLWRLDMHKSADCIRRTRVNMQVEGFQDVDVSTYVSTSMGSFPG